MEEERKRSRFNRICVFCGSSSGKKPSYQEAAIELGKELVERRIDLVYGVRSVGLMGLVSQAVHDGGRHVLGVIPRTMMPGDQITGKPVSEVRAESDMHQRKAEMARQADAFIALPGGYGTMEELLEVITWAPLGIHKKPLGLLNVDGYYNSLLSFIDKAVDEGFVSPTSHRSIISALTAKELVLQLEEYKTEYDEVTAKLVWEEVDRLGYRRRLGWDPFNIRIYGFCRQLRGKGEEEKGGPHFAFCLDIYCLITITVCLCWGINNSIFNRIKSLSMIR